MGRWHKGYVFMTLIAGCWWSNIYRTIWNIRSKQLVCSFSLCSCEKCVRGDHLALHGNVSLPLHFRFFASIFRSLLTFRIFTNIYKRSSQPFLYLVFLNEWEKVQMEFRKRFVHKFFFSSFDDKRKLSKGYHECKVVGHYADHRI